VLRDHAGIGGGRHDLAEELVSAPHGGRSQSLAGCPDQPSANLVLAGRD